jgi:hypothetical protein
MDSRIASYFFFLLLLPGQNLVFAQSAQWQGQLSGWVTSNPEQSLVSQTGMRYLPEFFMGKALTDNLYLDADISLNIFTSANFYNWEKTGLESKIKAYRLWGRFSTDRLEARLGLQKINFGSATLFRPLQWFDHIDPRDPLQITEGVYGLLMRYYFQNNANIWLWGLYGNDETKGQEIALTKEGNIEFGGRMQVPLFTGEAGLTYHHRQADFSYLSQPFPVPPGDTSVPEDRLALDGKWDVRAGLWFEGALTRYQTGIPGLKYKRALTVGLDYTWGVGNGLNAIGEHFISEFADKAFGDGEGTNFSGLAMNYPLGLVDNVSAILFYNWDNKDWYRTFTWQRTYDNWSFFLIGFWNPEELQLNQNQDINSTFAGKGFQLTVVFNH